MWNRFLFASIKASQILFASIKASQTNRLDRGFSVSRTLRTLRISRILHAFQMLRTLGWSVCGLFVFMAFTANANPPSALQQHFLQTQEALADGKMQLFVQSLEKMEKTYLAEKAKLSEGEREQFQFWLYRFQFKRYQIEANPPPIRDLESFESIDAINQYITEFEGSLGKLQKALDALRRYNQLYNKIALTYRTQAQIRLQASLRIEQDIDLFTRQGWFYIASLRLAQSQWNDKKALQQRNQNQSSLLASLREQRQRIAIQKSTRRKEQLFFANKAKESHLTFAKEHKALLDRTNNARILFIVGGSLVTLGAGFAIMGGIFVHDLSAKNPYLDYNCEAIPQSTDLKKHMKYQCEVQRALPAPIIMPPRDDMGQRSLKGFYGWGGPVFLVGGAILGGTGIALLIAGLLTTPPKNASVNSALRSHERFLKEKSSISSGSATWRRFPSDLSSAHRATILGIYH
ncbi:hypothetical protein L6R29_18630 [Myxococcota bacterium]|nr:hypothetical protein [Myxococcota bacterium]